MFDSDIEKTIILTGLVLWFANGWYLNQRLKEVHERLDSVLNQLNGLRQYLYEIDPQFEDERVSAARFEASMADPKSNDLFSGMRYMELLEEKEKSGKRTLNTPFAWH